MKTITFDKYSYTRQFLCDKRLKFKLQQFLLPNTTDRETMIHERFSKNKKRRKRKKIFTKLNKIVIGCFSLATIVSFFMSSKIIMFPYVSQFYIYCTYFTNF